MGAGGAMSANAPRETTSVDVSQEVCDLLYLCGCALAGEPADPSRVQRMNLASVHALAASQSLSALAWYGLESIANTSHAAGEWAVPDELADTWRSERDKSVRRQMLFGAERAHIFSWMRENGIWYVPLKGAVLADWYPRVGMREFSDNDILYDASRRSDVVRFFKERGYQVNTAVLDDSFTKEPVYHFEMHRRLFSDFTSSAMARYFEDMTGRLVSTDDSPYSLQLTREDFYLYLIAHANKHHRLGGTGVRILCDLRVLLVHEGESLDCDYVAQHLDNLEIGDFGASLERLAACVFERDFSPSDLRDRDLETLHTLTSYGMYGTIDHQVELGLARTGGQGNSTKKYVLRRLVPGDEWWEINFPFGFKHKWARGALLMFRAVRAALSPERKRRLTAELRAVKRKNKGGSTST